MNKDNVTITVSDMERRIIIRALNDLKQEKMNLNHDYDYIDDIILKTCDAPIKQSSKSRYEKQQER